MDNEKPGPLWEGQPGQEESLGANIKGDPGMGNPTTKMGHKGDEWTKPLDPFESPRENFLLYGFLGLPFWKPVWQRGPLPVKSPAKRLAPGLKNINPFLWKEPYGLPFYAWIGNQSRR